MSQSQPAAPTITPTSGQGQGVPPLVVNAQYVKDMSFEVPGAPQVYQTLRSPPQVAINLDVQVKPMETAGQYEVTLQVRAQASDGQPAAGAEKPRAVFIAELAYAGLFTLTGIPENAIEPVLLVECPRLLFPYARNILADVTRDGGFPPVLLQPIDFVTLWQQRRAQAASAQPAAVA
ncbi:MAG: protein-export chaperone SecB [Acidisphaera sp.]|nr:protein-export chaperone SecB [Acidisphaera sp.]